MEEILKQTGLILGQLEGFVREQAPMVWGFYLRQTIIDAWLSLIVGILMWLSVIPTLPWAIRATKEDKKYCPAIWVLFGFLVVVGFLLIAVEGIRILANPEYFTLKDLLKAIK